MQPEDDALPGLALDAALARVDGDRQLLGELAGLFLDEYPRLLEKLGIALERGNARDVEAYAHSLRGNFSNFGTGRIYDYALQLEAKGREGNLSGVGDILSALKRSLESVRPELEALARPN